MALPLSYNIRNVRVRWQVTLLADRRHRPGGGGLRGAHGDVRGLPAALRSTGRADNAIIVQRGSASELTSGVPLDQRNQIMVDDRVARGADGQPLASWEWVIVISLPKTTDGQPTNVTLRAVHAAGLRGARRHRDRRGPQLHARASTR